jgi:hypothetical protein
MFLANCVHTSPIKSLDFVSIGIFQRCKDFDVTGLKLVGGMGGEATESDVIFKTKLQDFEGLMRPKPIGN